MAYVYRHIRHDKNEPFYIGVSLRDDKKYRRALDRRNRSTYWKRIVDKTPYSVEILIDNISPQEALEKEIEFISIYRRVKDGGSLCNITLGGDGRLGDKLSKNHIDKIVKSVGIKVIDIDDNTVFPSIRSASIFYGINYRTLVNMLKGVTENYTTLRLLNSKGRLGKCRESYLWDNKFTYVNLETGICCKSISEAAAAYRIQRSRLYDVFNKHKHTYCPFVRVDLDGRIYDGSDLWYKNKRVVVDLDTGIFYESAKSASHSTNSNLRQVLKDSNKRYSEVNRFYRIGSAQRIKNPIGKSIVYLDPYTGIFYNTVREVSDRYQISISKLKNYIHREKWDKLPVLLIDHNGDIVQKSRSNRRVICKKTNKVFSSVKSAAIKESIPISTLYRYLSNVAKNPTTLRYL